MKSKFSIQSRVIASLAFALGYAGVASAHTQGGALGAKATASDIYKVTCTNDGGGAPRLDVQIQDLPPIKPPLVRVQVQKGALKVSSTDPIDGDRKASPLVSAYGGAGIYTVTVSKVAKPGKPASTRAYPEIYSLTYHCITGNEHTDTEIVTIQNQ